MTSSSGIKQVHPHNGAYDNPLASRASSPSRARISRVVGFDGTRFHARWRGENNLHNTEEGCNLACDCQQQRVTTGQTECETRETDESPLPGAGINTGTQ